MIATLTGKLKIKLNNQIVIDINGVGYCLHVSKKTEENIGEVDETVILNTCLLYTSPSPRDLVISRMPSSA